MDGPVLVHSLVDIGKEAEAQPGAQLGLGIDGGAVLAPGVVQPLCRGVAEAVAAIVGVEGAVEKADAGRQGVVEGVLRRVEDALAPLFARMAEAAEGDAEGERKVIGRRLGVFNRLVGRQRRALGAVDGGLRPFLGMAPGGGTGLAELDGGFTVGFVLR